MKIIPENLTKRESHELFMSAIVPRAIALISTIGEDGVLNLAPFSCFTSLCLKPAIVGVQIAWKRNGEKKDTLRNIEFSKNYVVNVVEEQMAEAMSQASAEFPSDVDEFKEVGLTPVGSDLVTAPRVAESAVNMECGLVRGNDGRYHLGRSSFHRDAGNWPCNSHDIPCDCDMASQHDAGHSKMKASGLLG